MSTADAEAALEAVRRMIGQPIVLMHGTAGWTLEPAHLRDALVIHNGDAGITPGLELTRFNDSFSDDRGHADG